MASIPDPKQTVSLYLGISLGLSSLALSFGVPWKWNFSILFSFAVLFATSALVLFLFSGRLPESWRRFLSKLSLPILPYFLGLSSLAVALQLRNWTTASIDIIYFAFFILAVDIVRNLLFTSNKSV